MSDETQLPSTPAEIAKAAIVKRLEAQRDKLDAAIIAGFNRKHPQSKERHWPEDFPHENGMYECICLHCSHHFLGYKRRMCCKVCAMAPEKKDGEV